MMAILLLLLLVAVTVSAAPNARIINGSDATKGIHIHQASLQIRRYGRSTHICGGSLIAPNWILTAAHCTEGTDVKSMGIMMNEHSLNTIDGDEMEFNVLKKVEHSEYSGTDYTNGAFPNDIALLQLSAPAPVDWVIPEADTSDGDFAGNMCTISGWGTTETGSLSDVLQEINMEILSNQQCSSVWGDYIRNFHICIYATNAASCNGDSGGPMVCNNKLTGVTSWGVAGCHVDGEFYPNVYTRVSEYRAWISANMA